MTFHVPAVDITAWVSNGTDEEKAAVAAAIDIACREVGFIQILGHGIPASVTDGLASAMDDFFAQDLGPCPLRRHALAPEALEPLRLLLG